MKTSEIMVLAAAVLVFQVEAGAESLKGGRAPEQVEPRNDAARASYEVALSQARRLFYNADRTKDDLEDARDHFKLAKNYLEPSQLRVCEFWLMHPTQDFGRAEKNCLRALAEDEYHALMALAYIYEHGPEGIRNPAYAYSCYLLVAQIDQGDLYQLAKAGKKRMARELSRAERRRIDSRAGTGWSLF